MGSWRPTPNASNKHEISIPPRNSKRRLKLLVESRVRGAKGCAKRRIRNAASRREYVVGNMCRPKRFTKGQRLRRRPRAGSGFALGRGEPVGRHLQGHQGNGKNREDILLQTDSGLVLSPNRSALPGGNLP
ncbi:hypothetical protein EVAR_90495_1 [Eumeta japonica]|uniref:Uncharacterized protein n=1 Tax=Eumeta variegata TaxID=151549 RepID=A0A4C2A8H4_EUMVA|nr:hypothetical protein EVAR_90495_1 [Eumeta japonica]